MREVGAGGDGDRIGWEVAFLIAVLAVGGLAIVAAAVLVGGVGVPVPVPRTGSPETVVHLRPSRVVAGSVGAVVFLAAARLVAPRRVRRSS